VAFGTLDGSPTDWLSELDNIIDLYIEFARREPGFRALRFGGVIDERFNEDDGPAAHDIATRFTEVVSVRYGLAPTEELAIDIDMAVEVGAALLQRAFRLDRNGDERYITKARTVMRVLLEPHRIDVPAAAFE
jgi:hypothetical protein